jgi:ATP-dependent RNA helicase DOB1
LKERKNISSSDMQLELGSRAMHGAELLWVDDRSPCHVVYTDYRPTPLQHYMFPAGGDGLYRVVDEKGTFRSDNFHKALAAMEEAGVEAGRSRGQGAGRKEGRKDTGNGEDSDIYKIVKLLMKKEFDPVRPTTSFLAEA